MTLHCALYSVECWLEELKVVGTELVLVLVTGFSCRSHSSKRTGWPGGFYSSLLDTLLVISLLLTYRNTHGLALGPL